MTETILRDYALTYREAYEELLGRRAKIKKNIFLILNAAGGALTMKVKLPVSGDARARDALDETDGLRASARAVG
ncbi:MAG TPA: hypothetical protein VE591_06125 [Candidatus Acidoferrum sp.]|nr:hypothetical protein [Candidatus Acidoferrum sp.]